MQFSEGDFLHFFDGGDLQSQQIHKLDKSANNIHVNAWDVTNGLAFKKTISSNGNHMLVQMLTNHVQVAAGFRAYFDYKPIQLNCANWLNMAAQLLQSPDYPTLNCSWVITAPLIGSTISISFNTFEVKFVLYFMSTNTLRDT